MGTIRHSLGNNFFKPSLLLECSAHGKDCNIGRSKIINLSKASTFNHKGMVYQCSSAAARFSGALVLNGLSCKKIKRAIRRSGLKISNRKFDIVADAYMEQVSLEALAQQAKINTAYQSEKMTSVGIDTSFSQGRNARYSQSAMLEEISGEIVQLVILNKKKEKCSSNNLDVLGVRRVIEQCHKAEIPISVISTDECSAVKPLLVEKSEKQLSQFGKIIVAQNDAFIN